MSDGAQGTPIIAAAWIVCAMIATASAAPGAREAAPRPIPVAVLGDSDSHSYRDGLNGVARGGADAARTFNWLEVWARLRPDDIDPGPFVRAGGSRWVAAAMAMFGKPTRAPKKDDYLFNYAWSGARCATLNRVWPEQTRWLIARLRSEPARWRDGLVVLRIGINDFGQSEHLAALARDPNAMDGAIKACLAEVAASVAAIRAISPVRIALVGVAHDYDTPFAGPEIVPDAALAGVAAALDRYDDGLKAIADKGDRLAFVDDKAWLTRRFGARGEGSAQGEAAIAGLVVRNRVGDGAAFLHTEDGHPGTVAAGLFLQGLIAQLNTRFGWSLTAPSDEEIVALARG